MSKLPRVTVHEVTPSDADAALARSLAEAIKRRTAREVEEGATRSVLPPGVEPIYSCELGDVAPKRGPKRVKARG